MLFSVRFLPLILLAFVTSCGTQKNQDSVLNEFSSVDMDDTRVVRIEASEAGSKANQLLQFRLCADIVQDFAHCEVLADGRQYTAQEILDAVEEIETRAHQDEKLKQALVPGAVLMLGSAGGLALGLATKRYIRGKWGIVAGTVVGVLGTAAAWFYGGTAKSSREYNAVDNVRQHETELYRQIHDLNSSQRVERIDELVSAVEYIADFIDSK